MKKLPNFATVDMKNTGIIEDPVNTSGVHVCMGGTDNLNKKLRVMHQIAIIDSILNL